MPNLQNYEGFWVVSVDARAIFTKLVHDSIPYIPIATVGPLAIELEPIYYDTNVLVRDQLIDDSRIKF